MRNPQTSNTSDTSWQDYKESAKQNFENSNYDEALAQYRAALSPEFHCPTFEKQILFSNVVACRLKIGGTAMAEAAVEDAKKCIAINDKWSKGHVRLASAYIALGGYSNDACNSLQRALALDPSNKVARKMLLHELGKGRETGSTTQPEVEPSAPPMEYPRSNYDHTNTVDPSAPPMEYAVNQSSSGSNNIPFNTANFYSTNNTSNYTTNNQTYENLSTGTPTPNEYVENIDVNNDVDDSLTISDRFQFILSRIVSWYENDLNDNMKTFLKVMLVLVIIYIAFGGRFSLNFSGDKENRGNYEYGNAYDRYFSTKSRGDESHYAGQTGSYNREYNTHRSNEENYYPQSRSTRSNSFHFPNLFDGSILSMLILAAFAFICHRYGVTPMHAIWILNMMTGMMAGNRRRGMQGMGMGMMGMGYGMMNNQRWNGRRRG